ncbi:MAG TPA: sulfatase-like hydrolase/transferase [Geminicoccaceae bacterium]|nr:sulfatase-like hydrolase/transferase [Geminicoccaceae bacterium]
MRVGSEAAQASASGGLVLQRFLRLVAAFLWLSLLWNLPVAPAELNAASLLGIAGEIVVLFGLLALLPPFRQGRSGALVAYGVALATAIVLALALAELVIRASLARPLNPWLDLHLAPALVHLLSGTLGGALGWLALVALAALPVVAFLVTLKAARAAQQVLKHRRWRRATVGAAALGVILLLAQQIRPAAFEPHPPVSLRASRMLEDQWRRGREMLAALAEFERKADDDRFRELPADALLAGLEGADVLLMYVESYGRSALDQERYAATLVPRLEEFERLLADAGLLAASGWLTSPTVGGQSWLAHGTIESGLWLPDQRHYDLLVTSDRLTLTKAFAKAGYRTIAVKPAITMPWPEGESLGFERVYAAADLGYAGLPYNWVTMPDQYTLSVLERRERSKRARPLFAEVSLISSHAPWTPIPPVLDDWAAFGDGAVFSQWAEMGDPPEVVWRDTERVRHQYTLALDYVLGVLASYAVRFVDDRTLLIVVGDHQAAPLITGEGAGRDVPIHVIGGAPRLLEPFLAWGFTPGMQPAGAPSRRMDVFRDWFLGAFSDRSEAGS